MKDKELKVRLEDIEWKLRNIREGVDAIEYKLRLTIESISAWQDKLKGLEVKVCPKCKHPVLAFISWGIPQDPLEYQCLTCGSKFTCSNECICKLVEE